MKNLLILTASFAFAAQFAAVAQDFDDDDFGLDDDSAVAAVDEVTGVDEPADTSADDEDAAEGSDESDKAPVVKKAKGEERFFNTLPFCRRLEGSAQVLKPGATAWEDIVEGKFYPLGSSYRTADPLSRVVIQFGPEVTVELNSMGSFATRVTSIGDKSRAITVGEGLIDVKLPRNLPDGLFKVSSPCWTVVNPKGHSRYAYTRNGDGEAVQIRCVTGTLGVEGRHYRFPALKAANEIKIRTSQDVLFTGLYGARGDCLVELDQGDKSIKNFATGESEIVKKPLEWKLSPKTAVRIYRAVPAIGERMSVTIMTFDASGKLRNRCAFAEGRPEVNSGELGPVLKSEQEDLAKKAAEAAETVASEVEIDESEFDEPASGSDDSSGGDEDSASASDDAGDEDFDF